MEGTFAPDLRASESSRLTFAQIEPFKPEDNTAGAFTDESRFSTLFPKYREQYLKGSWKFITQALQKQGVGC